MKRLIILSLAAAGTLIAASAYASQGDIVRTDYSTPYMLATGTTRLAFPDEMTVQSWGSPAATTIDASTLAQWQVKGTVPIREGYSLVKFGTDPAVYAVSPGGVLHQLATADVAAALYGPKWQDRIVNLFYSYWPNYRIGAALTEATYPDGTLFKYADSKVVYYLSNGVMRPFQNEEAFRANRFSFGSVLVVPHSVKYVVGNPITGYESDLDTALML